MIVTEVSNKRTSRKIVGTLYVGRQRTELRNCKVLFTDEVVKILKPKLISERTKEDDLSMTTNNDNKRMYYHNKLNCKKKKFDPV